MAKFKKEISYKELSYTLDSTIGAGGYDMNEEYFLVEPKKIKFDFDPIIKGVNIQRPLVWELERKVALIDSILRRVRIGAVAFKEQSLESGKPRYAVIDGKQRINAILSFFRNEFPDSDGDFWKDWDRSDRYNFYNNTFMPVYLLGESVPDEDIVEFFIRTNTGGVPQEAEHIEWLKKI